MLSEEVLERLSERLVDRIESLNTYFIKKLGNQISDIGKVTPSQLRELLQTVKYGNNIDDIMNKLAEITDKNVEDIYDIFEDVAKMSQEYARQFYEYRKIKFIPFDENLALKNQVRALAKITANEYMNISKTFAYMRYDSSGNKIYSSLSETYNNIIDEAILNISQGRESFDMTMKKAMKDLTSNGLRTVDYANGYSRRADSSVRMNIMDGVRRLNHELQEQFGEEFGADGLEVSHHKNAAPDHIDTVDGKQFGKFDTVTINNKTYRSFSEINNSLERHVGELNCYHFTFQIILGVDEPMYSEEQLKADKETNQKGFDFEGNHYTMYDGTQLQRRIETKIRQYKDKQVGAKSINDIEEVYRCQEKIGQLTSKYNDLSKVSGLPTKIDRLRVDGYRKVRVNINSTKNIDYLDVTKEWLETAKPNSHKVVDRHYFEYEGMKYNVDNKNVVLDYSGQEKNVAEWLENTFGGEIYMIPRVNKPDGIMTADYLFRGEYWDLKTINGSGKRILEDSIKRKKRQSKNFIFDITNSKIEKYNLFEQLKKIYSSKTTNWVDKIIVKKDKDVSAVYKRK